MGKRYSRHRRRTSRRFKKKRGSKRNIMQKLESAGVRKKYTSVFLPRWQAGQDNTGGTISLCGGIINATGGTCNGFGGVNPDNVTQTDMELYQQFSIYGCKVKWFFAEPTTQDASPVQWSLAYSPNILMNTGLTFERMQTLASYQTGPCSQNRSISRYYALGYTKKKLGIDFDACTNYPLYQNTVAAQSLYGAQLPAGTGPSVHYKIFRNGSLLQAQTACRMQITYYVKYRGTKGTTDIR